MKKKGFTLVELLAVIAILAILVIMALPAVLRMFNQARKDSFTNEVNTVIRTARQQYLLSGGQATTYSKDSNPLSLTGNSELNYCMIINGEGKIIDFKATNGSYKYESDGMVDETSSDDIVEIDGEYLLKCGPIRFVNRQNEGNITVGDEVAIYTEHFYVISSDSTNTALLAKYNLLVGDVYTKNGDNWEFTKALSPSDSGYGLQNENAKGKYGATDYIGIVAFAGKGYWDNAESRCNGTTCGVTGASGLKNEYANASNEAGKTGTYSSTWPYVYDINMSSVAPTYIYNNPWGYSQGNGYTIAYYVEGYVNTLKSLLAPNNITGRLLTYEEASALSNTMKGNWSYWLGSAHNRSTVKAVNVGSLSGNNLWNDQTNGVRPVIVIPTSSMQE